MAILFYISGHGFGHASRQVEVINALGRLSTAPILIRSAVPPDLLARTLTAPYTLLPGSCDTGIIQTSSLAHDDEGTVAAALAFDASYAERLRAEFAALHGVAVDLIVGDIPPIAFDIAAHLRVPSIAIGNFTWDWIYETHPGFLPAGRAALARMRHSYGLATRALALPFATGFEVFPSVTPLPFIARRATRTRDETRRHFGLPLDEPAALLSFGGYGLPSLDITAIDCRGSWTIVTTDRVSTDAAAAPHVRRVAERAFVDSGFRYEDLVAAVDVVVTKPGYGIISECAAAGTAILYTSRGAFREYDVLVAAMQQIARAHFISQTDLFAGRWREALEAARRAPAPATRLETNGAEIAAAEIASYAS